MKAQINYKGISSIIILVCAFIFSFGQSPAYFNGQSFYQTYFNIWTQLNEKVSASSSYIKETPDSNIIIVGNGPYFENPLSIFKIDKNNSLLWSTHYMDTLSSSPNIKNYYSSSNSRYIDSDSSLIISLNIYPTDSVPCEEKSWIFKFDKQGNYKWSKYYSHDSTFTCASSFIHVISPNYSGGFLLAGEYPNPSPNVFYTMLINCDKDGNILWNKVFNIVFKPTSIIKTKDKGYLIAGGHGFNNTFPALMKVDSLGNPLFIYRYGMGSCIADYKIVAYTAGDPENYILAGSTKSYNSVNNYSPFLISVDQAGNFKWSKIYSTNDSSILGDIILTNSNNFFISGTITRNSGNCSRLFYLNIDTVGNILWVKSNTDTVPSGGNCGNYFPSKLYVSATNDLLIAGNFSSIYTGSNWTWSHFDSSGNGMCNDTLLNWNQVTPVLSRTTYTVNISSPYIDTLPLPIDFYIINGSPDTIFCPSSPVEVFEQSGFNNDIILYPNPSTGIFTIKTEEEIKGIEVFNVLGEKIQTPALKGAYSREQTVSLPRGASEGIYFVIVRTEKGTLSAKVVLQR